MYVMTRGIFLTGYLLRHIFQFLLFIFYFLFIFHDFSVVFAGYMVTGSVFPW